MIKHGLARTRVYHNYHTMKARCFDARNQRYRYYGGRGITVCLGWMTFKAFYADMGDKPDGLSIDRINNDHGYWCGHCMECVQNGQEANCRWASVKTQMNNRGSYNRRVTFKGETLTVYQWAARVGLNPHTLVSRMRNRWTVEKALLTPRNSALARTHLLGVKRK